MGTLTLPKSGAVYLDANPIIYTVERHADYEPLLLPLWTEVENDTILAVTSHLTLLETLVKPLRDGNTTLAKDYETLLTSTKIKLEPITLSVFKRQHIYELQLIIKRLIPFMRQQRYRLDACC